MNDLQDSNLYADLSSSEETQISGGYGWRGRSSSSGGRGFSFDLNFYIFGLGAAYLFGNPGVTKEEVQFVWERSFRFW